jgi:hypothetical protein
VKRARLPRPSASESRQRESRRAGARTAREAEARKDFVREDGQNALALDFESVEAANPRAGRATLTEQPALADDTGLDGQPIRQGRRHRDHRQPADRMAPGHGRHQELVAVERGPAGEEPGARDTGREAMNPPQHEV